MKLPLQVLIIATALSGWPVAVPTARAGGSSSNGPATVAAPALWKKVLRKIRRPFTADEGVKLYAGSLENFGQAYPAVALEPCAGKPELLAPAMPAELATAFVISRKQGGPAKRADFCSDAAWNATYGSLVMTLHEIAREDAIGRHIIQRALGLGGAISIRVVLEPKEIRAHGRNFLESLWFDAQPGVISWAIRGDFEQNGATDGPVQVLRHELMHLLTKRALGSSYPSESVWHDQSEKIRDGWSEKWIGLATTPNAAYIEGLAHAIERYNRNLNTEARVLGRGNFNSLHLGTGGDDKRWCYWQPEAMRVQGGQINVPIANEVYVASTMNLFFEGFQGGDEQWDGTVNPSSGVAYVWRDEARMKSFIDAVADHAPKNVGELARAFDQASASDLGWRWLREFYFFDYRAGVDGANISSELESGTTGKLTDLMGKYETRCVSDAKAQAGFLSPVLDREEAEAHARLFGRYAATVAPAAILADIDQRIADESRSIEAAVARTVSIEEADRIRAQLAPRFVDCTLPERDRDVTKKLDTVKVWETLHGAVTPMGIVMFFTEGCGAVDGLSRVRAVRESIASLRGEILTGSQEASQHAARLKRWFGLRKDLEYETRKVGETLLIARAVRT